MITLNKINYSQTASIVLRRSFVTGLFKTEPPQGPHTVFSCCTSNLPPFFPHVMGLLKKPGQLCFTAPLHALRVLSWSWSKRESQWQSPLSLETSAFIFLFVSPQRANSQAHRLKTNGLLACLSPSFAWVPLFWSYSDPKWESNVGRTCTVSPTADGLSHIKSQSP